MLTRLEKIKLKLFGRFKEKNGLTKAANMMRDAIRYHDFKTLAYLKEQGIPETIGKYHALSYADFTTTRRMIAMGYGSTLQKDEKKNLILNNLSGDRRAFEDPEAVPFCRRLGISMGLQDKNGNNVLLKGQTAESIQGWADQAHLAQVNSEFVAAASRGDTDMMRILKRSGKVTIDARVGGKTALFQAIAHGHEKASIWLLRYGARIKTDATEQDRTSPFTTPLGKALGPKLLAAAVQYNLTPAVQGLLDAGISTDNPELMQMAADNGNKEVLDLLHKKGAPVQEAVTEYNRRLDRLTRHEVYDEKDVEQLRTRLALLRQYNKVEGM